jgi:hypothetical protein
MVYDKYFKNNRPSISINSIKTYSGHIRNLAKKMDIKIDSPTDIFDNIDAVLKFYDDIPYTTRKAHISGLISFIDDDSKESKPALEKLRSVLIKDVDQYKTYIDSQEKSMSQNENWIEWNEVIRRYKVFEKEVLPLWRLKPEDVNKGNYNKLQMFVLISCYVLIPPRRALDLTAFKIRNVDETKDNYMKGKNFVFNNYKTSKTYGKNEVPIDTKLHSIIKKWMKVNTSDWLLNGANHKSKPISSPQLNNFLNNFFDKRVSVNLLRHSFLTHLYKDMPDLKDMKETAEAMGHSVSQALEYIKKD